MKRTYLISDSPDKVSFKMMRSTVAGVNLIRAQQIYKARGRSGPLSHFGPLVLVAGHARAPHRDQSIDCSRLEPRFHKKANRRCYSINGMMRGTLAGRSQIFSLVAYSSSMPAGADYNEQSRVVCFAQWRSVILRGNLASQKSSNRASSRVNLKSAPVSEQ